MSNLALRADGHMSDVRAHFVRKYRANPAPWPHGIGAWYHPEDWAPGDDEHGDALIATGEARARALDPRANVRAKGEPCPPLPVVDDPLPSAASTRSPQASTSDDDGGHVDADAEARRKKAERQARWRHNKAARVLRQAEGVVAQGAPPC